MDLIKLLQRAYRAYRRKKNWQRVVRSMAMVVVFCTTYALILPAITMESGTICGLTEHTHTDACYAAVHTHTEACYEKDLICGSEESEAHNHDDCCSGIIQTLICEEEHEHQATCYSYETGLVCGLEEMEGHSHDQTCWESELICGLEEVTEPTEETIAETTENAEETTEPTVSGETDARVLICGLEAHTHDEACYPVTEPETTEETEASEADPEADLETQEIWEASLSSVTLTGDWSEDVLAVAVSQLGYTESQKNYITDENGTVYHYTRYGQWYGAPYADWSAMFVSFCLHYADVEGIPADQDCQNLLNVLNEMEIYRETGTYTPVPGDLIFLDTNEDGVCDAVGILEELTAAAETEPETVRFLAGDWEGRVERVTMEAQDASVLGYAILPTEPDDTQEHTFESEEGLSAQVALDALTTAVPEDAVLTVTAVAEEDAQYEAMTSQLNELVTEEVLDMTLLDISFYDAEGEYLRVGESAGVSLTFPGDAFGGNAVKVFHFVDDGPVELTNISCSFVTVSTENGLEITETVLTFQTEGFSVFAVVPVANAEWKPSQETDPTKLAGDCYLFCYDGTRSIANVTKSGTAGLDFYSKTDLMSRWTLVQISGNNYKIKSTQSSGTVVYMAMNANTGDLSLTNAEADASVFTIERDADTGKYTFLANGYYIYEYFNDADSHDAKSFYGNANPTDNEHKLTLFRYEAESGSVAVTNLAGSCFAIVSDDNPHNLNLAMSANSATVNGVSGLSGTRVQLEDQNGTTYVVDDATIWYFEEINATSTAAGKYYVYTEVEGVKKYLTMLETVYTDYYGNQYPNKGSLTLTNTAQHGITVTANGDGSVRMSAVVNDYTGYITVPSEGQTYWTFNNQISAGKLMLCQPKNYSTGFTISYTNADDTTYAIDVCLVDTVGNPIIVPKILPDLTLTGAADEYLSFATIAPDITDYTYLNALLEEGDTDWEMLSVKANDGCNFRFYNSDPPDTASTDYHPQNGDQTVYLVYRNETPSLNYVLNIPSAAWFNNNAPYLHSTTQRISEAGANLYTVANDNVVGKHVAETCSQRGSVPGYYHDLNASYGSNLNADNYMAPGAEYVVEYWQAVNIAGTTCYFPENAPATLDADGNIVVTDMDGVDQTLAPDTVLTAKWKKLSDLFMVFVNHLDTILDTENKGEISGFDKKYYTEIVAIGHIYNPKDVANLEPDTESSNGYILKKNHDIIAAEITAAYDPTNPGTQLVIDAVYDVNQSKYVAGTYNQTELEKAVGTYIRLQKDKQIKLDDALVDPSAITSDNYQIYWYSQKAVGNEAYHVDAVLVGITQPLEIYKTFSGLTDAEATAAISTMEFPLGLINGANIRYDYTTLTANSYKDGVYTNDGQQGTSHIYKWTLRAIQEQQYTFEETNYDISGYDCSSLVSVHYTDGTIKYCYDTTKTYAENEDGTVSTLANLQYVIPAASEDEEATDVTMLGGQVESIIFANFYTKTGTGMFTVSKVTDTAGQIRLSGAEFTLYSDSTCTTKLSSGITNENGAVHFYNLTAGTYYLKETVAPIGYQGINTVWTVTVSQDTSGAVTVIIEDSTGTSTTLYDSDKGGLLKMHQVQNEPEDNTVTINIRFNNISDTELSNLETNYCLEISNTSGVVKTLKLSDATAITGSINGYTWTVTDLNTEATYTFTEKNYSHTNYLDTAVSASINGTDVEVTKANSNTEASFTVTTTDKADTINITNSYTNVFTLKITKVDASNGNAPISGVKFNIYGDFEFYTEPPTGTKATITYTEGNTTKTAYYIGATAATDSSGLTQFVNMRLSTGTNSFLYVIDEANTPAGYVKLDEPIVKVVTVDGTDPNYSNGVYNLTVENIKNNLATVTVTATKEWQIPADMTKPEITLTLYKKVANGKVTKVDFVTLDGTTVSPETKDGITVAINGWQVIWSGLTYADAATGTEEVTRNEYFIAEKLMDGYNTTYSTVISELMVDEKTVFAAIADGYNLSRSVTITNTTGYELPQTGGAGTRWMAPLGLMLILAASWLYWLGISKKKQGGVDSS